MRTQGALITALTATVAVALHCGSSETRDGVVGGELTTNARAVSVGPSPATAAARVDELRGRFHLPSTPSRSIARATVALPVRATGDVELRDRASGTAVRFALRGVGDAPMNAASGLALYAGAVGGADLLHHVDGAGTEDFVVFESRPDHEEITYDVDVRGVAGLRLVARTLEFLDASGTPRLRVSPPTITDVDGVHAATINVAGCAFDTDPASPQGRAITSPGATSCTLRVAWSDVTYPALLDPAWTTTGAMASKRTAHTATLLQSGKVLVTGGYDGQSGLSTAELYDPATGTFATTGAMAASRRRGFTATLLTSGKVLVAGGDGAIPGSQANPLGNAEVYDPTTGTFASAGSMISARYNHTATLLASGTVLIAAGDLGTANTTSNAELYDPATGHFTATGSLASKRVLHTATLLASGKVLVAAGWIELGNQNQTFLSSAELFNPATGTFSAAGSLTTTRQNHVAVALPSGKVLIAGGGFEFVQPPNLIYSAVSTAEIYDPSSGRFAATGSMTDSRAFHTGTLMPTGNVLFAGGEDSTGAIATTEMYDVASAKFAAQGSMATVRTGHTATLLRAGELLVTGGSDGASPLSTAELYGLANGGECLTADNCGSGFCVDGVCCDTACAGQCQACDVAANKGTCSPVTGAAHGTRPTCTCDNGQCHAGAMCVGDHMSQPITGPTQDCTPYVCDTSGSCKTACASVADCFAPAVCNSDGKCVAPPSGSGDSGGCSASATRAESAFAAWALATTGVALLRRRRRR